MPDPPGVSAYVFGKLGEARADWILGRCGFSRQALDEMEILNRGGKRKVRPRMNVDLVVVPRSKVARHLLSKSQGPLYKSLVSIGDAGSRLPSGFRRLQEASLRLEFEDDEDPDNTAAPTSREVGAIIKFAPAIERLGGRCLIHCEAGISRSTAAAAIIARVILGQGSDDEALRIAYAAVPEASPNRLMLRLADLQLGHGTALCGALARRHPQ